MDMAVPCHRRHSIHRSHGKVQGGLVSNDDKADRNRFLGVSLASQFLSCVSILHFVSCASRHVGNGRGVGAEIEKKCI